MQIPAGLWFITARLQLTPAKSPWLSVPTASGLIKEVNIASKLVIGKRLKLEYESGVVVDGLIKKLTLDADGNLQVITFTNVMANKQGELLFDKAWGDFDIAIGNHIEKFELIP